MNELLLFYQNLYSDKFKTKNDEHTFLTNEVPTLDDIEQSSCEGLVTGSECLKALKTMENNKSLGTDGFACEFYKFFWKDIEKEVINSFNYAYENGEMSIDQKRGLISLIPKKDKDRLLLKNWRPVALLNTDYKILAKVLANRLKPHIDKLIHPDQIGYIKGRYIGENIRTVDDIVEYFKRTNKSGIILLIDFEKAFDSVRWEFIKKSMEKFNFGQSFCKWISVLYNNSESAIINNGFITEFFKPKRGVRQGCPLSVYLFLFVVELLAVEIRKNKNVNGIIFEENEAKISQLADDTTIFLADKTSIPPLLKILELFKDCSGLKANVEKTKVYGFGAFKSEKKNIYGLSWEKGPIQLLGVTISENTKDNYELNFLPKLKVMKNLLNIWKQRKLSLKGKITVINSLIISLFVYSITNLRTPDTVLDEIDKAIFDFLWDGKKAKISRKVIQGSISMGGLKMPDIYLKAKAFRLMWLKRALMNPNKTWVKIINAFLQDIKFIDLIQTNSTIDKTMLSRLPHFYADILTDWSGFAKLHIENACDVKMQSLWYNQYISIDKKAVFWKQWYNKGISKVSDILTAEGTFMSQHELSTNYGLKISFLEALQIRQSLPHNWRQLLLTQQEYKEQPKGILIYDINRKCNIDFLSLSSKDVYWALFKQENKSVKPACTNKWEETFNFNDKEWSDIFCMPFKVCKETRLQTFQYKIIHRIFGCNHWLHNIKVKGSPNCEFCNEDDTIIHYFIGCRGLEQFWESFMVWWKNITDCNIILNEFTVLFGTNIPTREAEMFNYCMITAKLYIYEQKRQEKAVYFYSFLPYLKNKVIASKDYNKSIGKKEEFSKKWNLLLDNL